MTIVRFSPVSRAVTTARWIGRSGASGDSCELGSPASLVHHRAMNRHSGFDGTGRRATMKQQVVLLRVGVDAGCGGIQGPLFEDGTFQFICIPDNQRVSIHTYGNMVGRNGESLLGYFPRSRRKLMAEQHVHVDPEFETFTYDDP